MSTKYTAMISILVLAMVAPACNRKTHEQRLRDELAKMTHLDVDTARGKKLYSDNGCIACHGEGGRGDGPAAAGLPTKPRNYREIFSYKHGFQPGDISRTIASGVEGTAMPSFAGLPEKDRDDIAKYVTFLQNQP